MYLGPSSCCKVLMLECSPPCHYLLLHCLVHYAVHGCGDERDTMFSKQDAQGNLQEGAPVTMLCRSVHGGLSPIARAHVAQHPSPVVGKKRVSAGRPDSQGGLYSTANRSIA